MSIAIKPRPTSLTVVAWVLIVMGLLALLGLIFTLKNPVVMGLLSHYRLPAWVTLATGTATNVINIVLGIAILKARAWARVVYVVLFLIGTAVTLVNIPFRMYPTLLPGVLIFALLTWLMYRRPATEYFHQARV